MHCTGCGAALADGAHYCSHCGASSASPGASPAAAVAHRSLFEGPKALQGCGGFLVIVALLWAAAELAGAGPVANAPPVDLAAAAARARACDSLLATGSKEGLIRERPSATSIVVDEDLWAALPAKEKRIFAAAVRCSALAGNEAADTGLNGVASVEGYRSGRQLAVASGAGVTLD